jgi:hypothetical protein
MNPILEHYITWFKAHERLVLFLAVGFFAVHLYSKHLDYRVKQDQVQAQISTQQAQIAAAKTNTDDANNKLLQAQLQVIQQQVTATNLRVDQAMRDRAAATVNQKRIDDQSNSAELAARIRILLGGIGTVQVEPATANIPDRLVFDMDAAHTNADKLEDAQQAKADVIDLNTKLVSCATLTAKQADTITGLNGQIADGKTALKTEQDSHAKDVKTERDKARGAWLRGFKWGAITVGAGIEAVRIFVLHKP